MSVETQNSLFDMTPVLFDARFMADHAGRIINEPRIAIVELVANAYDAGATRAEITWPVQAGEQFLVTDNGTGMSKEQFHLRWRSLNYDRLQHQGKWVKFPPEVKGLHRTAFGQSGKGRWAPFCFDESYTVTTWQNGQGFRAEVSMAPTGTAPFNIIEHETFENPGHGTTISAFVRRNDISPDEIAQLIGGKFLIDPSFEIFVNGSKVQLLDLEGLETQEIEIPPHGKVTVHFIDTTEYSRTTKLRGITWWKNGRMMGEPSWNRLDDDGAYLDGRQAEAKRFSFIVKVDDLPIRAKPDWTGFHADLPAQEVTQKVHGYVLNKLHGQLASGRKQRKLKAIENSRQLLDELPRISQKTVSRFIDEVQEKCPSITERDLSNTVEILARLEESRWQYDLIRALSACSPDDLDKWTLILREWTASSAEIVLGELQRRLRLLERMEQLVNNPTADELHQLQPLFERGLWIFGTEYESVDFRSNRGLTEIVYGFLGEADGAGEVHEDYEQSRRRIDLIALPRGHVLEAFSADSYIDGRVAGIRKVLIVELKKGGFGLSIKEIDQARNYAVEIKSSGRVQPETQIEALVLGSKLANPYVVGTKMEDLNISITPMIYDTILQEARLRTFDLRRKLKEAEPSLKDGNVEQLFGEKPLLDLMVNGEMASD